MDSQEKFKEQIRISAEIFKKIDKNETIRLVSHLDCDGLSSCAIMIKAMNAENRRYAISIVPQLDKDAISQLAKEQYNYFLFTDLGSGHLTAINNALGEKKVFILDHHLPENFSTYENIAHINPHIFGLDGNLEISASGIAYLFASRLNKKLEEFAHIAIIGACGDMQENNGFKGLNNEILNIAISHGIIEVTKGLRIFGRQTRPLHKVLEYTTDPYIPDVTGSESGAIQFLYSVGIEPKNANGWKKLVHLSEEEMQRLVTGIVLRRMRDKQSLRAEDVLGNVYTLKNEPEGPLRDVKEFSTLLNACGRLNKPSLGIGACIGDSAMKDMAIELAGEYKRAIVNAMNWFEDNKNSEHVINGENYVIINAKGFVLATIIGTLASMIAKSNNIPQGRFILSMAQQSPSKIKVSLRLSGHKRMRNDDLGIDLRAVIKEILNSAEDCEFGGHENAAGAIIPSEKEGIFIDRAKLVLGRKMIEEKIG